MKRLKRIHTYLSVLIFRNKVGLRINVLGWIYYGLAQITFLLLGRKKRNQLAAVELRENGFQLVPRALTPETLSHLATKIDHLLSFSENRVDTMSDEGFLRLKDSYEKVPEIENILKSAAVQDVIQNYFGSHFKVFSSDIYRMVPSEKSPEKNYSRWWHLDNAPPAQLKIMFYITDATKTSGALSVVPKTVSRRMVRRGFWDRMQAEPFLNEIEQKKRIIEAQGGTTILFEPQFCIHKATQPEHTYRDVVVFLLYPSLVPFRSLSRTQQTQVSRNFGYLVNPFFNTPLRSGIE